MAISARSQQSVGVAARLDPNDRPSLIPGLAVVDHPGEEGDDRQSSPIAHRLRTSLSGLAWPLRAVALVGIVGAIRLWSSPAHTPAETDAVSGAYLVSQLGSLGPLAHRAEHPPLGELALGGWSRLTDSLDGAHGGVANARELVLLAHVAAALLVYVLARRLALGRPAATLAVLVFGLSPVVLHSARIVALDTLALPLALGALVLASARSRRALALPSAVVCACLAALVAPATLLVLPILAWIALRTVRQGAGWGPLAAAGGLTAVAGLGWMAAAGSRHLWPVVPSHADGAWAGAAHRLQRVGGGVDLTAWLTGDALLPLVGLAAATFAVTRRPTRPVAALVVLLSLAAVVVEPTGLMSLALPLDAVMVAAGAEALVRWSGLKGQDRPATRHLSGAMAVVAIGGLAAAWLPEVYRELSRGSATPTLAAVDWVTQQLPRGTTVLTDEATVTDLLRRGSEPARTHGDLDIGTAPLLSGAPSDWRGLDVVVLTPALRARQSGYLADALASSSLLAGFGTGTDRAEVRRVLATGEQAAARGTQQDDAAAAAVGAELARNPALTLSGDARRTLVAGAVDARVMTLLALVLQSQPVAVVSFPQVPGAPAGSPRRIAEVVELGGRPVGSETGGLTALRRLVAAQPAPYSTASVAVTDGAATVSYPATPASGLLPIPGQEPSPETSLLPEAP